MTVASTTPRSRSVSERGARVLVGCLLSLVAILGGGVAASGQDQFSPGAVSTTTVAPPAETSTTIAGDTGVDGTEVGDDGVLRPETDSTRILTESRKIMAVVGGLVAVSLVMAWLTVRYWRQTRPVQPEPDPRPAVNAEQKPVVSPVAPAAQSAGPEPVAAIDADRGQRSRMSIAGADHASADDDWEPHGNGEHERIELPAVGGDAPGNPNPQNRPNRPTRAGRAAALGHAR